MYQDREQRAGALPLAPRDDVREDDAPASLELHLQVRDPDLVSALSRLREGRERDEFALAALRIGVLSLEHARGAVDARTVREEVEQLLDALGTALTGHRDALRIQTEGVLKDYFDPQGGRFAERVERLTKEDGELASVLRRHLSADDSTLARTLASHLGAGSPVLRLLDPQNAEGLVASLRTLVNGELEQQREQILRQFSLDQEGSALRRLVGELTQNHGKLSDDLQQRIGKVTGEFSLDDPNSALSRLVARVEHAQRQITSEFDLNAETSALARLRRELLEIAQRQESSLTELRGKVETELRVLATRRAEAARSTTHGNEFEERLCDWLQDALGPSGDVFLRTGQTTGQIRNCKVGDAVLELGAESQAAGARIVFEAKEVAGYGLDRARAEIDEARRNRGAAIGVFVFSRSTAPAAVPPFSRHGCDVFGVWDADDAATDVTLHAAISVARALSVRAGAVRHDAVDLGKLDRAIREVQRQIEGLEEIRTSATTIQNGSGKILDRVRKLEQSLASSVTDLDACAAGVRRALSERAV